MAVGDLNYNTNNRASSTPVKKTFTFLYQADLADSATLTHQFSLPFKGRLTDVQLSLAITGAVASGFTEVDVFDDGTSVLSTLAKIEVTAANGAICEVGATGTGITAPVIDATKDNIAEDSVVKFTLESNGTFTTQPSGCVLVLEFIEEQDFDPAV